MTYDDLKRLVSDSEAMKRYGFSRTAGSDIQLEDRPDVKVFDVMYLSSRIHKIAKENPGMNEAEFRALVEDIRETGLREPILVYRDKVIDGRHRLKAFQELGYQIIPVVVLSHNTTLEEARRMANSGEIRRHQTVAQKAIKGYRIMLEENIKMKDAAIRAQVNKSEISRVKRIAEELGTKILDELFDKGKVQLPNGRYTGSLPAIISYLNDIKREVHQEPIEADDEATKKGIEAIRMLMARGRYDELGKLKIEIEKAFTE